MSKRIVLFQALAATITDLTRMLREVDRHLPGQRPAPNVWSMADVLSHLIAVEGQYFYRLQRVLTEERPFLPAIHPDPTTHNLQADVDEFAAARQKTLALLQEVTEEGWGRTAVHETQGEVTFQFLVQFLVDHDREHLNQMAELREIAGET